LHENMYRKVLKQWLEDRQRHKNERQKRFCSKKFPF
jgi:hypothetical protein